MDLVDLASLLEASKHRRLQAVGDCSALGLSVANPVDVYSSAQHFAAGSFMCI